MGVLARVILIGMMVMPGCFRKNSDFDKELSSFARAAYSEDVYVDLTKVHIVFSEYVQWPVLAMCMPDRFTPLIMVSRTVWDTSDDLTREAVIWHELGHCVLNREHVTDLKPDGHPVSLMYPTSETVRDENYYLLHKSEYIKELFKKDVAHIH